MNKALCEPITISCQVRQTPRESNTISIETKSASHQCVSAAYKAKKAPCKPKIASAKAIWIKKKSNLASCKAKERSLDSASCEANSALHRAQSRLSHEAKDKAPLSADSEVNVASLPLPALSAKIVLSRKAKTRTLLSANVLWREANIEAPLGANSETTSASLSQSTAMQC